MGLTRIRAQQISNIDYKQAVRVVTTTNIANLAGGAPNSVDSVNLTAGDRILVTGQDTGSQNGLYYVATLGTGSNGTWTRTSDGNETGEIEAGMVVMVTEGATYADTPWKLTTNDPIVVGTTALVFVQFSSGSGTPGGSNTQIQYNSANTFAGSSSLTWNGSELFVNGTANVTGNVTGNYFFGNGSQLTGIQAGAVTTVSSSPPGSPAQGDIWIDSDTGIQYIYFTASGNSQWAEMESETSISISSLDYGNANVLAYLTTGVAGNILPSANVTYDLGSTANRWNDIWLANSTIYLGEANISASGTAVVLPAGTTIGGSPAEMPKIANVQITNSSWTVLDDTAISTDGGYFIVNGSGFQSGATVTVDGTNASSVTFISSNLLRCQIGAKAAASYTVYVINPDGGTALRPSGLTYSGLPTWVTASQLANAQANIAFTYTLSATGAVSYALAPGNTIPTGSTLAGNGVFSGNVAVANSTSYSFTVTATDAEQQDADRTFSLNVNVVAQPPSSVEYLVVAGGGSGGSSSSGASNGGGGAGGLLTGNLAVTANVAYTVTVGAGGAGGTNIQNSGSNSSLGGSVTAVGGGFGGIRNGAAGANGGSGGGGSSNRGAGTGTAGPPRQGYNGGTGADTDPYYPAGGGGGAGGTGGNGSGAASGNGGVGLQSSISGAATYYAGGGGGGVYTDNIGGTGGLGGGGNGAVYSPGAAGQSGTVNTGGGGGGSGFSGASLTAGAGGSGIVIIRYPDNFVAATSTTGSPEVTVAGGYRIYKFTGSGSITW